MTVTQDAPTTQGGQRPGGDQPWSFARVRVSRGKGGEGMAPGTTLLVLQGVYEGSDGATIATAISEHILEKLRQHPLYGRANPAQPANTSVRVRITIERLPDLPEVPVADSAGHDA